MNNFLLALKKPNYYIPLILSLIINALLWFLIVWRIPATNTWIPLHYHVYFGIDWIGPWRDIIYFPLLAFIVILLNLMFSYFTGFKNFTISLLLVWTALLIQLIILISLLNLIINYF